MRKSRPLCVLDIEAEVQSSGSEWSPLEEDEESVIAGKFQLIWLICLRL